MKYLSLDKITVHFVGQRTWNLEKLVGVLSKAGKESRKQAMPCIAESAKGGIPARKDSPKTNNTMAEGETCLPHLSWPFSLFIHHKAVAHKNITEWLKFIRQWKWECILSDHS